MFFNDLDSLKGIVISAVLVYFFILIILKVSGKRTLSDLSVFDFVITITMGPIAGNTIISKNTSVIEGFVAIATLALLQYILVILNNKFKFIEKVLEIDPTLLYYKGKYFKKNMRDMRITKEDILQQVRTQSGTVLENVNAVILESNGKLSVISDVKDENLKELEKYK